jgi:hypothetical protein
MVLLLVYSLILLILFQRKPIFAIPGDFDSQSKKVANFAMIGWCFGVVATMLGLATGIKRNRKLAIAFGIFLLPVWVTLLLSGRAANQFVKISSTNPTTFCKLAE